MKAEVGLACFVQLVPVATCSFKQRIGADDVGLDKLRRASDRAINMRFGRQVHDGIGLVFFEHPIHVVAVADIDMLKGVALALIGRLQRLEVACIGQLVDVNDGIGCVGNDVPDDRRTDKACTACY